MFSVLMVEMTLFYNHATAVLGGPDDNELHLPSELLPLLIGAFGFLRTCWLKFEEWRSPSNPDPSMAEDPPEHARRSRTMRVGVRWFEAFSERLAVDAEKRAEHEAAELDELERGRSRPERYLVAWLPWLSLLKRWRNDTHCGEGVLPVAGGKGKGAAEVVKQVEVEGKKGVDAEKAEAKKADLKKA
jgi:hypothetical protein